MRERTKKVYEVANNPWFIIAAGGSSIIALFGWLYDKYEAGEGKVSFLKSSLDAAIAFAGKPGTIVLLLLLFVFSLAFVYSLRVRWENMALRKMSQIFYEINLLYKAELQKNFAGGNPNFDPASLLAAERRTLTAVSQRIGTIFTMAIGRPCLVSIKLVVKDQGQPFAQTYVRSEDQCLRDAIAPKLFALGTGENTCYDAATAPSANGRPPHFFSPNLRGADGYCTQRQHHLRYYKSILVVPIRAATVGDEQAESERDLVGFLSVDTLSTNRLNNRYHLYMLAALAHQMYNFISLMRGRYTVFVGA